MPITTSEPISTALAAFDPAGPAVVMLALLRIRLDDVDPGRFGPEATERISAGIVERVRRVVESRANRPGSPGDPGTVYGEGDEVVLLAWTDSLDTARELIREIARATRATVRVEDTSAQLRTDLGVAVETEPEGSVEERAQLLLRTAALGLERQQPGAKDPVLALGLIRRASTSATPSAERTGPASRPDAGGAVSIADALEHAIAEDDLVLHHRPVIDAVGEHLVGLISSVHWDDAVHGRTTSASIEEIAADSGLAAPLATWVLRQATADLRRLIDHRGAREPLMVLVMLSDTVAARRETVHTAVDAVRDSRLRPGQLVLGLRADHRSRVEDAVRDTRRALRRVGFRVALDGIGTTADPLGLLAEDGGDLMLLDAPLTMSDGRNREPLACGLVLTAHGLGLRVLTERVDTTDLVRRARAVGCDLLCGDAIGPSGPIEDLLV